MTGCSPRGAASVSVRACPLADRRHTMLTAQLLADRPGQNRTAVAGAAMLLLATASGPLHAAIQVHAVRVGLDVDHSRLVLVSDQPIRARVTRDVPTGALLIDLDGVEPGRALAGLARAVGANNPFIAGVRLCPTDAGTRLELATPTAATPRLLQLRPGDGHASRLVIDLYPASADWRPTYASPAQRQATPACVPTPVRGQPEAPRHTPAAHAASALDPGTHVNSVAVAIAADRLRLVLESDRALRASIIHPTESGGPLAVDLGRVAAAGALASLPGKIADNPFLTAIRLRHEGDDTLLELVTPSPVTPQVFHVAPVDGHGDRLVVDIVANSLTAARPAAPAPTAAAPAVTATPAPAPVGPPPAAVPATTDALTETWLEVHVNGTPQDTVLVLRDAAGHVLVRAADLQRWRIQAAAMGAVTRDGEDFWPLSAITGLTYRVDGARGTLLLDVPATLFASTRFSGVSRAADAATPPPPGGYLNYDLFAGRGSHGSSSASALVQTGVFGRWGSGSNTWLMRDVDGHRRGTRLDTLWTYDRPSSMTSLRFGDTVSAPSSWGRGVRFGGVQWGTNFATQPGFITFPLPALTGVAAEPSTVDFYVNNVLRLRREVPSGPFTIQDLPIVTGQGDIQMVVRDLLGREQVVTQPFYASGGLLAPGLRDYSYELGFQRENYGLASNDYGRLVATATERRGFTDNFTGELHAEAIPGQLTAGLGGTVLLGSAGVLTASLAGSDRAAGSGALAALGFQHQSRYVSYGARTQLTTAGFVQLGYEPPVRPPRQTSTAFLSFGTGRLGSLGLNYTHQDFRDHGDIELVGAHYSRSVGWLGYLSLSALRFLGGDASPLYSLTLTVPLGVGDSASFNGQGQAGTTHGTVQYQHSLPVGTGVGYRLQAGLATDDPRQADITLQNDVGTYAFGMAASQGKQAYQASVRGGVALLGGELFPSRHIDDSFAVVQVPGFANVRVYADNQVVGTTDADGYALVPRLRPYQANPVRIEQADLPMDAQIQGLQLDAVPYYHSALMLTFPVTRSRGAIVVIKLADGSFLPAGAEVAVHGNPQAFPVGMQGEVYLTGLAGTNRLQVSLRGQRCDLAVNFPETTDPLPRLGPVTCQGIDPP